jgi:hypothetical protein
MTRIRRLILFLFSTALIGASGYVGWLEIRCASGLTEGSCALSGRISTAAATMMLVGGYLLWDDFIGPWIRSIRKGSP